MIRKIFTTGEDVHLFVLRVVLGAIFFAHGLQTTVGWFGGPGFSGIMQWFANSGHDHVDDDAQGRDRVKNQHIPAPLAFLAVMAELLGGLALVFG